jgi:hypothetical protein
VRAVTRPYPGAFAERDGRRIVVWKARIVEAPGRGPGDLYLEFPDGVLHCVDWEDQGPVPGEDASG